jgi:hypothetical protein
MRQYKRLKYFLTASLVLTVGLTSILLFINVNRLSLSNFSLVLFLIIALGPNLMHIYVSYSMLKNYFPNKEVPRSFIITFQIISVFASIVCIGLMLIILGLVFQILNGDQDFRNWHFVSFAAAIMFLLLVCLMPFQFSAAYKLLSIIHENHKKNLLESFN